MHVAVSKFGSSVCANRSTVRPRKIRYASGSKNKITHSAALDLLVLTKYINRDAARCYTEYLHTLH